jgi:hypothetical protein
MSNALKRRRKPDATVEDIQKAIKRWRISLAEVTPAVPKGEAALVPIYVWVGPTGGPFLFNKVVHMTSAQLEWLRAGMGEALRRPTGNRASADEQDRKREAALKHLAGVLPCLTLPELEALSLFTAVLLAEDATGVQASGVNRRRPGA